MNARAKRSDGGTGGGSPAGSIRVCVLYGQIRDWRRAWLLLDRLHAATGVTFNTEWFSFAELPVLAAKAGATASDSELVLVSASKITEVTKSLSELLEVVKAHPIDVPGAVIGLFADSKAGGTDCPWEDTLHRAAWSSGRDLFIHSTDPDTKQMRPLQLLRENSRN